MAKFWLFECFVTCEFDVFVAFLTLVGFGVADCFAPLLTAILNVFTAGSWVLFACILYPVWLWCWLLGLELLELLSGVLLCSL